MAAHPSALVISEMRGQRKGCNGLYSGIFKDTYTDNMSGKQDLGKGCIFLIGKDLLPLYPELHCVHGIGDPPADSFCKGFFQCPEPGKEHIRTVRFCQRSLFPIGKNLPDNGRPYMADLFRIHTAFRIREQTDSKPVTVAQIEKNLRICGEIRLFIFPETKCRVFNAIPGQKGL